MQRRFLALGILVISVLLMGGLVSATTAQPEELELVKVEGQSDGDLLQVESFPVQVYARLTGDDRPYLLVGAPPGTVETLRERGFDAAVLDGDLREANYYLAYPRPGVPQLDWDAYGRVLLDDGVQVLLRLGPQDAERLVRAGAALRAVSLDPKPLPPAVAGRSLPPDVAVDSRIQAMVEQVDSATLFDLVGELSGETAAVIGGEPYTITTRHTDSGEPIEKATQYAAEHLSALGLDVEYHDWAGSSHSGRNVIGELTGENEPEEIFILCAHIDDLPSGPEAPGADDNASGVVAVLTAADILSQYRWGCTLRFALWTGEEQGLWGSHYYAQRSYSADENIAGVLNLDMIAWNTPLSTPDIDLHATPSMTLALELAQLFSDVIGAYGLDLVPEIVANGTGSSDHASFWDYGYPAILGIEDYYPNKHDFNPYYHTPDDQLQYLDMDYFADFVKASLATFAHMSDCLIYPYAVYLPLVVHQASAGPRR